MCGALGPMYIHQLSTIFLDVLKIYQYYSENISQAVAEQVNRMPVCSGNTKKMSKQNKKLVLTRSDFLFMGPCGWWVGGWVVGWAGDLSGRSLLFMKFFGLRATDMPCYTPA